MLAAWDSPVVRRLLAEETIGLGQLPARGRLCGAYPFLNKLTLPAGVGDLAKNRPPADVILLAPKASLVVRRTCIPRSSTCCSTRQSRSIRGPGSFSKSEQFPAAGIDRPSAEQEARQFYRSGRPFLQRHLPFWLAVLVGRLLVLLIPLVGVLYPLLRFMPALYGWAVRWRIFRVCTAN